MTRTEDYAAWRESMTPPPMIRKEDAACCAATKDEYGRYCIGWCGPNCERRPKR